MPTSNLSAGLSEVALQLPPSLAPSTLVIIDAGVHAVEQLAADIAVETAVVHRLKGDRSGIAQITEIIRSTPEISAIHLISHGEPATLHLGNESISLQNLLNYIGAFQQWATKLKGKDLMIYGCEVGQGARGYLFLQQLHQLTNANISASDRCVGLQNWELAVAVGHPSSAVIFSEALQSSYAGQFVPIVNLSLSADQLIETETPTFSINFSLSEPPPSEGTLVTLAVNETAGFNRFDLGFGLQVPGLAGLPTDVSPNLDFSAFQLRIVSQNASISFPLVSTQSDENLNGSGPIEDFANTADTLTFSLAADSGGTIGNGSASVTIFDNAAQVPAPPNEGLSGDFNGDGQVDLLLYQPQQQWSGIAFMDANGNIAGSTPLWNGWKPVAQADFNQDGQSDIVVENLANDWKGILYWDGTNIQSSQSITGWDGWDIVGSGNFNDDGTEDLLIKHQTQNWHGVLYMGGTDGSQVISSQGITVWDGWEIKGVGDFNGDGRADLVAQHSEQGWHGILELDDNQQIVSSTSIAGWSGWDIVGTSDQNEDGQTDILIQNQTQPWTGALIMNGNQVARSQGINSWSGWQVAG